MAKSVDNLSSEDELDYTPASADRETLELVIPVEHAGLRLDQVLALMIPAHSRSRLQNWIKAEQVRVDGEPASAKAKVWGGEIVRVQPQHSDEELSFRPEDIPIDVVYEDAALLVINKPAGLVVHPGSGNWEGTLLNGLLYRWPASSGIPRAGIVHRLDKDTSGLMVVAKTLEAQTNLVRQLQARSVKREYFAIVRGAVLRAGKVDGAIGRDPRDRTKMAMVPSGKPAVTHYEPVERLPHHTLIMCRLETGRTHQIRVHMQSIGHALAGDLVYRGRVQASDTITANLLKDFGRQALHATRLALRHPDTNAQLEWEVPMASDMTNLLNQLRQLP